MGPVKTLLISKDRRLVLRNAVGISIGLSLPSARPQDLYPSRTITIVVPFGPGGSGNLTARTFARYLERRVGQSVVVENKPGANGIVGSQSVRQAAADGHSLLMVSNMTHAANVHLYKKLPYDPLRDFEHAGIFGVFGVMLLVPAGSPFKSMSELVKQARAKSEQFAIGHFNASTQVAAQLLAKAGNIPIRAVGYRTIGNAMTDVLGGHIHMVFADYPAATAQLASGKFIPIAITESQRNSRWPDLPAISEYVPGFEMILSLGLATPAGTNRQVLDRINTWMAEAQKDGEVRSQLEKLGYTLRSLSVEGTRGFLKEESGRWERYVRELQIETQ